MKNIQAPMILLLGQKSVDKVFVKTWLENSRFRIAEASNVFQLLEELSDFTVKTRPDVIILEAAALLSDFSLLKGMLHTSQDEIGMPLFILSDAKNASNQEEFFRGDLAQLSAELDKLIPPAENQHR